MSLTADQKLSGDESRLIAALVREEIARRRISRQRLADEARISLSTLEKALAGRRPFTLATTVRLEGALGLPLRKRTAETQLPPAGSPPLPVAGLAPEGLGSYSRPAVSWIEGDYVTVRPSFSDKSAVYAYRTAIRWEEASSNLIFEESNRLDAAFTQAGSVSVPHQSGHIYLVTNKHGQYRLIIVSRPTIGGEMHGILTTLQVGRGAHLTPVATPIVFAPLRTVSEPAFGQIRAGHPSHAPYRALLRRTVEEPFALFLPG